MKSMPMPEPLRDGATRRPAASRRFRSWARLLYVRMIRPHVGHALHRQRLKLLCWDIWGYWRILVLGTLSLRDRLRLLGRFLRIDWNVPHAHKPHEISCLLQSLSERRAQPGEIVVEAGCWQGGSS